MSTIRDLIVGIDFNNVDVGALLNIDSAMDEIEGNFRTMSRDIDGTGRDFNRLGSTGGSAMDEIAAGADDAGDAVEEIRGDANQSENALDDLGDTGGDAMDEISDGADDVTDSLRETEDAAEKAGKSISENLIGLGDKMTGVGKKMSLGITTPLLAAGGAAFKFATDQETAFAQVTTLLDSSQTDFDTYKKEIRAVSSELGVSFEDLSESVYSSISAGQDSADAIGFTKEAIKLAGGGFTTTANAVDVMTTALNAYKLESDQAANISDMLITTQNLGKTTVDELSASMGAVIPIAQAQGVQFDELAAGYAVLTKNGVATAEAGTGMKAMFGELGKAGSKTDKILRKETGKSFSELIESGKSTGDVLNLLSEKADSSGLKLSDMFGSVEAGGAALTLASNGAGEFTEFLGEMNNSSGATEEAFNKMADTTGDKMRIAWTTIKNAAAGIGDAMLPIAATVATFVAGFVSNLSDLSPAIQTGVLVFGALAAAIGPVLIFLGSAVKSVGVLLGVFNKVRTAVQAAGGAFAILSNPIGLTVAAIGLLIAGFVLAYNKLDWFREAVNSAWEWIKQATSTAFEWVKTTISNVMSGIMAFVGGILAQLQAFWTEHGAQIMALAQVAFTFIQNEVINKMTLIWSFIQIAWNMITTIISTAWEMIKIVVQTGIDIIMGVVQAGLQILQGDWSGAWETLKGVAGTAIDGLIGLFKTFISGAVQIGKDFVQGIIDGFLAVWDSLKATAQNIWDSVTGIFSKKQTMSVDVQQRGGPQAVDGSHAAGLNRVPFDGYIAELHKDEAVLTAREADAMRKTGVLDDKKRPKPKPRGSDDDPKHRENRPGGFGDDGFNPFDSLPSGNDGGGGDTFAPQITVQVTNTGGAPMDPDAVAIAVRKEMDKFWRDMRMKRR